MNIDGEKVTRKKLPTRKEIVKLMTKRKEKVIVERGGGEMMEDSKRAMFLKVYV